MTTWLETFFPSNNNVNEKKRRLTCAAESVDGECVAGIASAEVRTISVDTAMLTKMESFIALMNLWCKQIIVY